MNVNIKLKEYLDAHGIKVSFLAEKTGIERSKLSKSLAGKRKLSGDEFTAILNALGLDSNFFTI